MKNYLLKNKNNPSIWTSWLFVIGIMIVIFNMSGQVAEKSNELSLRVTEVIVEVKETIIPPEDDAFKYFRVRELNNIIRKNAHFFIFCTLGFLLMNAMRRSEITRYYAVITSLSIGVLYAISDEVHQYFVPGRGPQVKDVLIDSGGVIFGILLFILVTRWKKNN